MPVTLLDIWRGPCTQRIRVYHINSIFNSAWESLNDFLEELIPDLGLEG